MVTSCVVTKGDGRARAGGSGEAEVHNQKQEPHTKMWGTIFQALQAEKMFFPQLREARLAKKKQTLIFFFPH